MTDTNSEIKPTGFGQLFLVGLVTIGFTTVCQGIVFWPSRENPSMANLGISYLIGTATLAAGCFAGILFSPSNQTEKSRFTVLSSAIGGLISGYALARIIEPVIQHIFDEQGSIFRETETLANILVGSTMFLVGAVGAYVYRTYYWEPPQRPMQ